MPSAFKISLGLESEEQMLNKKDWGSDEDNFDDGFNIDDGMYFKLASTDSDDKDVESDEELEEDESLDDLDEEEDASEEDAE